MIQWFINLFKPKECAHRFDATQVQNLNIDPRCKVCNHYFSAITARKGRLKFELLDNGDYTVKRIK